MSGISISLFYIIYFIIALMTFGHFIHTVLCIGHVTDVQALSECTF